jgi:predicted dehydrogenase
LNTFGTTSIIESGWWQPHADGPEAATRLYGTKGYASVFPTFVKWQDDERPEKLNPEFPARADHCDQVIYNRQMAHFVDCVRNRTIPVPGLKEGLAVLEIVDAAYESSRLGEAVIM